MKGTLQPYYISEVAADYLNYMKAGWYYNSERACDSAIIINGPFRIRAECFEEIELEK